MTREPPKFLFIHVNQRCNLRCQHCEFWRRSDRDKSAYLTSDRKRALLEEFAGLSPHGHVVICGGESMLDIDEYFAIAEHCRHLGLRCLSVVNGTRISSADMARRMMVSGPHEVSVSLDSHIEAAHDRSRGCSGSFRRALNAISLLLQARKDAVCLDSRVYVMGLISRDNYLELEEFYDVVLNALGADKLKLNFVQPSFGCESMVDSFFASHYDLDVGILMDVLNRCDQKYSLHFNPAWLRQVRIYFESLHVARDVGRGWRSRSPTLEHLCNSYERNVIVDLYGVARLCFSPRFPGMKLDKEGDLGRFWETADPIRNTMRQCNAFCGISHSVRSESSTLRSVPNCSRH